MHKLIAFLALAGAVFGQQAVRFGTGFPGVPINVSSSGGGNVTGTGSSAANDIACITNTNSTAIGPCKTGGATIDPTTGDAAFPRNVSIGGTLSVTGGISAASMPNAGVFTGDATSTFPAITIGNGAITAVKMVNAGVHTGDAAGTFPTVTVQKVNGIAYSATAAAHSIEVITTANTTATAKVIPDCTDTGGNHINFTQSTDAFSCGTSGGFSGTYAANATFGAGTGKAVIGTTSSGGSLELTDAALNGAGIRAQSNGVDATTFCFGDEVCTGGLGFWTKGGLQFFPTNSGTSPYTCAAGTRGLLWYVYSASMTADQLQQCMKKADDTYAWVVVKVAP